MTPTRGTMKPGINKPRLVVRFSCGAASAVAAKLTLKTDPDAVVVNAFIAEEHEDNRRFLADVERWLGKTITVLRDTKYNASAYEVMRRHHYTRGQFVTPCSYHLKREVLEAWSHPTDIPVLGFTIDEQDRADRYLDANNGRAMFPLIENGLDHAACLAIVQNAGLVLPAMYRLGYNNANCIGCIKGGEGYWNKIRRDFPETFEAMCQIEESSGPSAYLFRNRTTGARYPLRQLAPNAGRHDEPEIECGFACLMTERELNQ